MICPVCGYGTAIWGCFDAATHGVVAGMTGWVCNYPGRRSADPKQEFADALADLVKIVERR